MKKSPGALRRMRARWHEGTLDCDDKKYPWHHLELRPRLIEGNVYDQRELKDGIIRWTIEFGDGETLKEGTAASVEKAKALTRAALQEVLRELVIKIGGI